MDDDDEDEEDEEEEEYLDDEASDDQWADGAGLDWEGAPPPVGSRWSGMPLQDGLLFDDLLPMPGMRVDFGRMPGGRRMQGLRMGGAPAAGAGVWDDAGDGLEGMPDPMMSGRARERAGRTATPPGAGLQWQLQQLFFWRCCTLVALNHPHATQHNSKCSQGCAGCSSACCLVVRTC